MIDIARIRDMTEFQKIKDPKILELAFNSAIKDFERGTRRYWARQVGYVETQQIEVNVGSVPTQLWFKLYPIETISLIEWYYDESESDAETIESDDYNLIADIGKIIRNQGFYYPFVKATITGGYTNDQIWDNFPDIVQAIVLEVQYNLKRNSDENIIVNSQSFEKGQTNLKTGFHHAKFEATVKSYRRMA